MREVRNLLIGFEIGDRESQMAYYDRSSREAVSVPTKVGTNIYTFPTELAKNREKDEWHYGIEAEYFSSEGVATLVKHLVRRAENGQSVTVDGNKYEAWELLGIFFENSLKLFGSPDIVAATRAICVTAEHLTPNLAAAIRKALRRVGFRDGQFLMEDEAESFYYYGYSQQPQIWARDMGLLKFDGNRVSLSFLEERRKKDPHVVKLRHQADLKLPEEEAERDFTLAQFVKRECGTRQISAIFITGRGFSQKWAKMSVHALAGCGNRVYEGGNLFVKGACYAAAEKKELHRMKGRVYEGADLVRDGLTIDVIDRGALRVLPLLIPGSNWYENGTSIDFILDGREDIVLTRTGAGGHSRENIRMDLDGLPERPNRTTRIRLTVECISQRECVVRAEDLGFGEFFPATHRVWQISVPLNQDELAADAEDTVKNAEEPEPEAETKPTGESKKGLNAGPDIEPETVAEIKQQEEPKPEEEPKPVEESKPKEEPKPVEKRKTPEKQNQPDKRETNVKAEEAGNPETMRIVSDASLMDAVQISRKHSEDASAAGRMKRTEAPSAEMKRSAHSGQSVFGQPVGRAEKERKREEYPGGIRPVRPLRADWLKESDSRKEEDEFDMGPRHDRSSLERLMNLKIPSIQPEKKRENPSEPSSARRENRTGGRQGKSTEDRRQNLSKSSEQRTYSSRFGIDFDADIPEEEDIDTGFKGGEDQ